MTETTRWCGCCKQYLPVADFGKGKRKDGLHQRCKRCNVAAWQKWYQKNRAKFCAYVKGLRDADPGGFRAHSSAQRRAYRKANPDHVRALDRARYKRRPANHMAVQKSRRRARVKGAPGRGISAAEWRDIRAAALGVCPYCGNRSPRLSLEHIVPIARGGAHDPENVIAVCGSCNRSKRDTPLVVWLVQRVAA